MRRRALLFLTLDGSNISSEVVLLVKLGNSANFYKIYILGDQLMVVEGSIPVDPAGGHRYWNSIKTCESRVARTRRTAQ